MNTGNYSPGDQTLTFAGHTIRGFAAGTYVALEFDSPAFTKYVGAGGEVSRAKSMDKSGKVTITLAQTSKSNEVLSALAKLDRASSGGAGIAPFLWRDRGGTSQYQAPEAWIAEQPKPEAGDAISTRVWVIEFASMDPDHGGN